MSHGVTSRTAGLYYFGDAGGLNEATSDIFGSSVEFFANNANDPGDYYIGEKIDMSGAGYLRRMDDPDSDGVSFNCWSIGMGIANPHYTSGPGNHFFYLLSEGSGAKTIGGLPHNSPVCDGGAVTGIGRAKAAKIWYRALSRYMVSTTNYIDARDATIHAAIDLYGKGSNECKTVVKAWNAVTVPGQYWTCKGGKKFGKNTFGTSRGFEPPNGSWQEVGQGALTTRNPNYGIPHTGKWYGLLNFFGQESDGTFKKQVKIPNSPTAMLRFYMLISVAASQDGSVTSSTGTVDVKINGRRSPTGPGMGRVVRNNS